MTKPTVHRHLRTMTEYGFAEPAEAVPAAIRQAVTSDSESCPAGMNRPSARAAL
ncbi:helix-turn-helix domain-containing protein [Streptomyces albidoflavus]